MPSIDDIHLRWFVHIVHILICSSSISKKFLRNYIFQNTELISFKQNPVIWVFFLIFKYMYNVSHEGHWPVKLFPSSKIEDAGHQFIPIYVTRAS